MEDGIGHGPAGAVGHQDAVDPAGDLPGVGGGAHQEGVQQARAPGVVEELAPEADEAPGGNFKLQADPAGAVIDHLHEAAPAAAELFGDDAHEFLGDVHHRQFQGFPGLAVDLLGQDLGLGQGELKPLPAHHFDEHRQLQLPPGADPERVPGRPGLHPDADVVEHFFVQALLDVPGGEQTPFLAGQGRGVDREHHGDGGLFHGDHRQGPGIFGVAQGVADEGGGDPGHRGDIARGQGIPGVLIQTVEAVDLGEMGLAGDFPFFHEDHFLTLAQGAVDDLAHRDQAHVVAVIQVGHQELQGGLRVVGRGGDGRQDGLEQGDQVLALCPPVR